MHYKKISEQERDFTVPVRVSLKSFSDPQEFDFRQEGFGRSKAFYFRDPDGIILEIMQPLEY